MTDADRLRKAADVLDRRAQVFSEGGPSPAVFDIAGEWCKQAELLRAVADDVAIGLYIVGAESPAAALALADTILGDES